ncbi:MAG: tetratricopeptide repeat protein [Aliidongia sp.]
MVYNTLGTYALNTNNPHEAREYFSHMIELSKKGEDFGWRSTVAGELSEVELSLGNIERAIEFGQEAVSHARPGKPFYLGLTLNNLASYLVADNRSHEARQVAREGFQLVREEGGVPVWMSLQLWAVLIAIAGRGERRCKDWWLCR